MTQERLETKVIPALGPLDAKLCFIGEAPGEEEDASGLPFVGSAGQLLNRCFMQSGIVRSEVLITNVFSQRPPNNKVNYFFNDPSNRKPTWEGEEHIEELRRWLGDLYPPPNVLVALGAVPLFILTGKKRIGKWRGSVLPCTLVPGYKVYPAFHPSYVNRLMNEPKERLQGEKKTMAQNVLPLLLIDLQRAKEQSEFKEIKTPERTHHIDWSHSITLGMLDTLNNPPQGQSMLAVDIETLPGETGPIIWCIGFSEVPEISITIPIIKGRNFAWSQSEESAIWLAISKIFLNPNVKKVFQGGAYDLTVLGRYYGLRVANGTYRDTMLCHHATYPYIKKGLETLASIYTLEPYYKDEGKLHMGKRSSDEAEFRYNGKDCCVTREIFPIVARNAREANTWEGYLRTMSIMPSLIGMMIRGVRIDVEKKKELTKEFTTIATQNQDALNKHVGEDYNINSSPQVIKLLYGYYSYPIQQHPKTGKRTSDKEAITKLRKKFPNDEVLKYIQEFRKYAKLASTYADMKIDEDDRVRTSYGFTSTWRLTSSESHFGSGGNLQNIPKRSEEGNEIRKLFLPDEGKEMGACDLKQAEAMVVAWEAEDLVRIEAFLAGVDIHWESVTTVFGLPSDEAYDPTGLFFDSTTKQEFTYYQLRTVAKTIVHATNYKMGIMKFQAILMAEGFFFNIAICKALLSRYLANNPFIEQRQRKIREEVKATRTLTSAIGRKREFMGRLNEDLFRVCYAFSPQSTVGEITEVGIKRIGEEVPFVDALLNVHDEVVFQYDPENRAEALKRVEECMTYPLEIKGRELIIPCDFKVGSNWGELEEI